MSGNASAPLFSITERVFEWATRTPDRIAMIVDGRAISFAALGNAISGVQHYFRSVGLEGPGVAALAMWSYADFWAISLALRGLGLTTVAMPSLDHLSDLALPDLRCVVAIAGDSLDGLQDVCAAKGVDIVWARSGGVPGTRPLTAHRPGGHILQTSGTTGAVKMVLMDPSFEAAFVRDRQRFSGVNQQSVLNLFNFGPWTGGGYKSVVSAWSVGACVVFDQGEVSHRPLLQPGVSHSMIVPSMVDAVVDGFRERSAPPGGIRLSSTGGPLSAQQIQAIRDHVTTNLFNGLGATETHSIAYTRLETPEDQRWHQLAPGRDIQIVDDQDRPVAVGQTGQLRVSTVDGPTGYLNDEAATKAFFRGGYFYPGDLAVMREDGRIALQGRVTEVINFKGHKLAPAPTEAWMCDALGVAGVCLFSKQDDAGEEEIHVIIENRTPVTMERLTPVLRQALHGYPRARVHHVPALPRNEMGKVMRLQAQAQVLAAAARG